MITESQLEQLALSWFQEVGWAHAAGPDIAPDGPVPERTSYNEVVLRERLREALERLNPQLPSEAIAKALHAATTVNEPTLVKRNQAFHRLLLDGVPVDWREGRDPGSGPGYDHARLLDFQNPDNNDFLIVDQFTITGTKQPRRPDLIAFVNGLPLAVIELKNPVDEDADVWHAYHQLATYKEQIDPLFTSNVALVVSDGFNARIGSLNATPEWYMPWRVVKHEDDKPSVEFELETLVRGFFDRALLLDYLRYFILFEKDGDRLIKKIAGYHQFHGVREAVKATLIASRAPDKGIVAEPRATYGREVEPGSRKAGVFWHTQGSGKSISMACYAGKLLQQPEMQNPTLVVVTDRNDLDGQLFQQFSNAQDLLKQQPVQVESRDELREKLAAVQSGGIFFTTVQKFGLQEGEGAHPVLCERSNVVVISDEAHRSQYGQKGRLNTKTGEYVFGFSKYMRDALPNASFIGFTGTPISTKDKDTRRVFGDYVSIYDIQDAVDDKATVPILYESRLAKLDVNAAQIEQLNKEVDEVVEDEESVLLREKTKSKWAELAKLVGAKPRLEQVAADLVKHFETRTAALEGKAMIVCMSRQICVDLFNELVKLRPQWAGTLEPGKGYSASDGALRVVMTGNATDEAQLQPHLYTKQQRKELEKRFKKPDDTLRLVIVRDMWLTGFDVPCCHTMYVDKPMHGSNLMQAIARVNRVFADKPGGLVVDYIGIASDLRKAIKEYTDAQGKGDPAAQVQEAYKQLLGKLGVVRELFRGFDYSAYATKPLPLLVPATNHILATDERKKHFLDEMAAVSVAYSFCNNLDEVEPLKKEIAFFEAIKAVIMKNTVVDKRLSETQKNSLLKHILDNAVVAEGVTDVFALAGLDKPNIGLLDAKFLDDLRHLPQKNFAVELLARLLRDEIKARSRNNVVQERTYSERLLESLRRYHNRAIESAQVIEELINMARDLKSALERNEHLGLNTDEIAFYDALAAKSEVLLAMGDETLKKLAVELTERMRKSTTVDWQHRESVRASMRLMIRQLLKKYKYPPEGQEDAVALVIKQAEVLAEGWG
ncbi:MAG: type I restriction endonuclease subunit R [Flavobacteriales bacterium]|nr:type I restriction endonuclease subunit R [Flavobacteriales bacterium]